MMVAMVSVGAKPSDQHWQSRAGEQGCWGLRHRNEQMQHFQPTNLEAATPSRAGAAEEATGGA